MNPQNEQVGRAHLEQTFLTAILVVITFTDFFSLPDILNKAFQHTKFGLLEMKRLLLVCVQIDLSKESDYLELTVKPLLCLLWC